MINKVCKGRKRSLPPDKAVLRVNNQVRWRQQLWSSRIKDHSQTEVSVGIINPGMDSVSNVKLDQGIFIISGDIKNVKIDKFVIFNALSNCDLGVDAARVKLYIEVEEC